MRSVRSQNLKEGMVLALPFDKKATIVTVKVGRQFVHLTTLEHPPTRVEIGKEMMIEGPDDE